MNVSDQIIAVLNDLCTKFGIAIDWTAENILPQITNLCEKYVRFEIYTSIAWCVIMLIVTLILYVVCRVLHPKAQAVHYDIDYFVPWAAGFAWAAFAIMSFATVLVCGSQVFDIIECCTIPEKLILEYLKGLLTTQAG